MDHVETDGLANQAKRVKFLSKNAIKKQQDSPLD
jgi:hypothetical protein